MKVTATAKFVGTSSRKLGLVAGLVRGQTAAAAQTTLAHTPKSAATPLAKVLSSAMANAVNNHNLKKGDLVVESVLIGPAPTLKRFRPRARGAAGPIKHRSSHITVVLSDAKPPVAAKKTIKTPKEPA